MGKGLANRVGLTWATVRILALGIVHVRLVEWLASNLIGPLYNRLCVSHGRSPLALSYYACTLCLFI